MAPPPNPSAKGICVEYTSAVLALCLVVTAIQNYLAATFVRLNILASSLVLEARVTTYELTAMGLTKFGGLILGNYI